ncbi:UNVERIFIED_CONTAM: VQ motif-containing protein 22 [Sesamum indicum]
MDSAHSGSLHSSSGGDEEFDSSRGDFNPFLVTHQNPTFFDPQHQVLHNLDHAFRQSNGNDDNSDLIWSRSLRSQHNYAEFGNITSSASLPLSRAQSLAGHGPFPIPSPSPSLPLRAETESRASLGLNQMSSVVIKNPKKRTRASRRAPTTVLKTDTANFRQMVQEFTGIPADPFSASHYSRRPDVFSALRPGTRFDPLGPLYPLRPSPQKGLSPFSSSPPPPSLLNSNMVDSTVPTTNIVSTNTTAGAGLRFSTSNNSNNYPFPHQLGGTPAMNFGNLSGFQSEEITAPAATARVRDSDNLTR